MFREMASCSRGLRKLEHNLVLYEIEVRNIFCHLIGVELQTVQTLFKMTHKLVASSPYFYSMGIVIVYAAYCDFWRCIHSNPLKRDPESL